ncbi:prepilin-type N-terminal cleavage/methylation domain-containing protein [Patescibacteria group bacterium]
MKSLRGKIQSGFTIIEALIAVTVLSVGFVAVIQIFPGVIGLNSRSEDLTIGSHLAEMKLEEFLAKPYANINLGIQPEEPVAFTELDFTNFKWQAEISEPEDTSNLKQLEITVFWGNNNQYNTSLSTYKTN